MIRVYFDWNVFSNLKRTDHPEVDYQEIKNFIEEHKNYLQFPYTPAHFSDLMKSYKPDNDFFEQDLKTIEYISENHFICFENNNTQYYFGPPCEYFKYIKNKKSITKIDDLLFEADKFSKEFGISKLGSFVKDIFKTAPNNIVFQDETKNLMDRVCPDLKLDSNNLWEVIENFSSFGEKITYDKDYYKDYRNKLLEIGYKLESNSGNWEYFNVIDNINNFLKGLNIKMTFFELAEASTIPINGNKRYIDSYIAAYTLLDILGYKSDKLRKSTDNFLNISVDAEHSFYGAHCDFLVADDRNLRIKSKVLYNEFGIKTKIIEPKEFIYELTKVIDKPNGQIDILNDVVKFCKINNYIGVLPSDEVENSESYFFKLTKYHFNFFNIIRYWHNDNGIFGVTFEKTFNN